MKMFIFFICFFLIPLVSSASVAQKELSVGSHNGVRIIGGQTAYAGQFKYLAAINIQTSSGRYFCGGTLLTNEWVMTAGQCVDGAIQFTIQLGSNTLNASDPNHLELSTDTFVLHPDYDSNTLANDIGLIQFRMAITFTDYIAPVDYLPSAALHDSSILVTMGWGQTSDSDSSLQKQTYYVSVTSLSNTECKQYYGNQVLDPMVCAIGNYNQGTCYGDIGGPLIQYISRGEVMAVAVASFISQNGCESTDPSGYTRVFDYAPWIINITGFD